VVSNVLKNHYFQQRWVANKRHCDLCAKMCQAWDRLFSPHRVSKCPRNGRAAWMRCGEGICADFLCDFLTVSVLGFVPNGLWTTVEITAYSGQVTVMKSLSTFDQSP
jgi:hypothetical protein